MMVLVPLPAQQTGDEEILRRDLQLVEVIDHFRVFLVELYADLDLP
jgi:hypothetical protein